MGIVTLKHTGAVIDQQIDRVIDGSVVVDNTLSALDETSNKPVSGGAVAKELAERDTTIAGLQSSVAGKADNADFRKESIRLQSQIDSIKPIEIVGDVTNAPDEEDITTDANNLLKLKDRPYGKGLGYKILRSDKTFAEQVTDPYTIYEVRYDFELTEEVSLPEMCVLNFEGGSIESGTIIGNRTAIKSSAYHIFRNVAISGTWIATEVFPEWFGAVGNGVVDDTLAFNKAFDFLKNCPQTQNTSIENKAFSLHLLGTYNIGMITIPRGLMVMTIRGGAIVGGGFHFVGGELPDAEYPDNDPNDPNPSGYKVTIEDVTFFNEMANASGATVSPIIFDYANKEYGEYIVRHCTFGGCDTAITIRRRSCRVFIEHCTIYKCKKAILLHNTDYAIVRDNWIDDGRYLWQSDHSHIEIISEVEGDLFVERNIFIPYSIQTNPNPCWIRSGKSIIVRGNRFSDENTSIYPLRLGYDNAYAYDGFNINKNIMPIANVTENIMCGGAAILLDKFIGRIVIDNNTGWNAGKPLMRLVGELWVDSFASAQSQYEAISGYYQSLIGKKEWSSEIAVGTVEDSKFLTISIKDNAAPYLTLKNNMQDNLPDAYKPSIPEVLIPFVATQRQSASTNYVYQKAILDDAKKSTLSIKLPPVYFGEDYKLNGIWGPDEVLSQMSKFLILGVVQYKTNSKYFGQFALMLTFECLYRDGQVRYIPQIKSLIDTAWEGIVYTVKINGVEAIPYSELYDLVAEGNATLEVTVEYTGTYGDVKIKWQNVSPINDILESIGAYFN